MYRKIIVFLLMFFGTSLYTFGQLSWQENSPVATGCYGALATADFNEDGLRDIAAAPCSGGLEIWYAVPDIYGNFDHWDPVPEALPIPAVIRSLAAQDINRDGFIDIAAAGNNTAGAWLHRYIAGMWQWVSANNFTPLPSGTFNNITLANVTILEEKYNCNPVAPIPCNNNIPDTPKGLDIIMTNNSTGGIVLYRWAGMVGTPGNCVGSWVQETAQGLPSSGNYTQVIGKDLNLDLVPDLIGSKPGGIDVYMRSVVLDGDGCFFDDDNMKYRPIWIQQNGEIPYSNSLPSQGTYRSVAVADVNYDLYPDIIAAGDPTESMIYSGIEIWFGSPPKFTNGATQWLWFKERNLFDPYRYLLIPGTFNYVDVGDFNNDEIKDIAAIVAFSPPIKVWRGHVFTTTPVRLWWQEDTSPTSESLSLKILSTDDYNDDGKTDISAVDNADFGIRAYMVTSPDINSPTSWYPRNIDINGYKKILASVRFAGTGIYASSGEGAEQGFLKTMMGQADLTSCVLAAALDAGDNLPDGNSEIKLYQTDGEDHWVPQDAPLAEGRYQDVVVSDINRDDLGDIVAGKITTGTETDGIRAWFNNATGWTERSSGLNYAGQYYELVVTDVDGDKFKDIVAAKTNLGDGTTGVIQIYTGHPNNVTGWLWTLWYQLGTEPYKSLLVTDINKDGAADIIGCSSAPAGVVKTYVQTTTGWEATVIQSGIDCNKIIPANINKDRLLDIAVTTNNAGIKIWLYNLNTGWQPVTSPDTANSYTGIIAKDLNNDGWTDIAAQQIAPGQVIKTWYWNPVTHGWSPPTNSDSGFICADMDAADCSNDHLYDLLSACDSPLGQHTVRANYLYTEAETPALVSPPDDSVITTTRQPSFQLLSNSIYTKCLRYQIKICNSTSVCCMFKGYEHPKGWVDSTNGQQRLCYLPMERAQYNMQLCDPFDGGLPDGTYTWDAVTYDGFKETANSSAWTFTINTTDKIPPVETYNIFLSKLSNGVRLTWNKSGESDVNRYRIYRNDFSNFIPLPSNLIDEVQCPCTPSITYDDTRPFFTPQTYYKIKAVDTTGNQGP